MTSARFLTLCTLIFLGTQALSAQSTTKILDNVTIEVTEAKLIGKTPPVRNLIPQNVTPADRKQIRKDRKKEVPNFVGRQRPTVNNLNALPQGEDPIWQQSIAATQSLVVEPIVNFDGLTTGQTPHDPCGDISKDHYIQMINATTYRVYDKMGNPVSNEINANTLWASLGFTSAGDPIIMYDQEADRWIITEFPLGNQLLVAVSETSDPLGSFVVYNFGTPNFPDYPKYSVWNNSYIVTTNEQGPGVLPTYILDRQALLNGEPTVKIQRLTIPGISSGPGFFVGTPVDWNGMTPPPAGANPMVLRLNDDAWGASAQDQIDIFSIDINWDNPQNTTVSMTSVITSPFDTDPCREPGSGFSCIPQFGEGSFDGSPEVIMHQSHYRNFGSHESIVLNFITDATGFNLSGIRWVELRRVGGAGNNWTLYQEGTWAPNDGLHRFMGSIAIDGRGNIGLAYSVSSEQTYAGLRFTGRRFDDPLGEMTVVEYELAHGLSNNPSSRFGDYAQMSIDPVDDRTFWFTGEYQGANGTDTRIAAFKISKDFHDLAPTALVSPVSSPDLTDSETISMEITNLGLDTQQVYNVGFVFENDPAVIEAVNLVLPPASTYVHTFAPTVDLSTIDDYQFLLFTQLAIDEAPFNDSLRVVVHKQGRNDAGITQLTGIGTGPLCGDTLYTGVVLTNFGVDPLLSANIDVELNGVVKEQINWTGNLLSGASDTIDIAVGGMLDGSNTITVTSSAPNGMMDEILDNDDYSRDFQAFANGTEVYFTLTSDFYSIEITWELTDGAGNVLFTGGPYTDPFATYSESWCLDVDSCYTFTIFDATGDGICCNSGQGNYNIVNEAGDTLLASNGKYGMGESNQFCATYACVLTADIDVQMESEVNAGDGTIMAVAQNGSRPFSYSLDGITYQSTGTFTGLTAGTYSVYVKDALGCEVQLEVEIEDFDTGVNDPESGLSFDIFPNPTAGVFRVEVKGLNRQDVFLPLEIYDGAGRLVDVRFLTRYDQTYTGQLSLVVNPDGVYFIRFKDDQINRLMKVIKATE